jgi:molybdate transport system ATP-binding protein
MTGLRAHVRVDDRLDAALEARPGSVVAVIGPNGAGKSTLLHALAGLVACSGEAVVDGTDLLTRDPRERGVGMVFQGQLLFPHLSALDNVAFGPRARGTDRRTASARAQQWLDRFGVGDLAARRPGELSGGQAQRVAIARALATDPALLLLDEPFAGLDVAVATSLRIEMAEHLRDFPGTTLLVTHDAIDALTLADHVVVLEDGVVAQAGSPAEVASRPLTRHVARLVGLNLVPDGAELLAFTPDAVVVSLDEPHTSSRLRWRGRIASATPHGDVVRLLVDGSPDLLADVTAAAAAELGLVRGREVWLQVKATALSRYSRPITDG